MNKTGTISSISYKRLYSEDNNIPFIRLRGKWLRKLGYLPKNKFKVLIDNGKIILELLK